MVAQRPSFHRQAGLGAVERLDLRFFVDREDHRMRRRIDPRVRVWPTRGQAPRPTMSRSLSMNGRLRDSLNWRTRCGWRPWVCQIRCTELALIPTCLAIMWAVQWVTSPGGSVSVNATVRSCTVAGSRGIRNGRVLSRSSPSTPLRHETLLPAPHGDLALARLAHDRDRPEAVCRHQHDARSPYVFCALFRSATIACKRARSALFTSMVIPSRMRGPHHPPSRVCSTEDSL